jgi:hypothetical protein
MQPVLLNEPAWKGLSFHLPMGSYSTKEYANLHAMLREARTTNQHIYFEPSSVVQMMVQQDKLRPEGVQVLCDLFTLALRTRSSHDHMRRYAETISGMIRGVAPCHGAGINRLLATSEESPRSITEIRELIRPLVSAISQKCFGGDVGDFESKEWQSAGRALVAVEKHLTAIEQFDPEKTLRDRAEVEIERENTISGEASTVMNGIRELLRDRLPPGVTLSHEETEKETTGYRDEVSYSGKLTIYIHVGAMKGEWLILASSDSYSKSALNDYGRFDRNSYHYYVKKDTILAKLANAV